MGVRLSVDGRAVAIVNGRNVVRFKSNLLNILESLSLVDVHDSCMKKRKDGSSFYSSFHPRTRLLLGIFHVGMKLFGLDLRQLASSV